MKATKLDCKIEIDRRCNGASSFIVSAGDAVFDVTVVSQIWKAQPVLKAWLIRVRRLYLNQKNRKICVGFSAIKRNNSGGIRRARKLWHYEILGICVGAHCLLIDIDPHLAAHPTVKDFLKQFFRDESFVFVGFRIKDVVAKIHDDYKDTDMKWILDFKNLLDLTELATGESRFGSLVDGKCGLEGLIKAVLNLECERPKTVPWYSTGGTNEFSEEFILWSSLDVYMMAKLGTELLNK